MHSDRISWIDVSRGIGITLVLYAHALNGDGWRYLFYAFHMPLFFFLSGLVFHLKKHESLWGQIKKAFKGILYPYFFFSLLFLLMWIIDNNISSFSFESIVYQLKGILIGNGNNNYLAFNVVLWFLPCLFLTRVTYTLLHHIIKRDLYLIISLIGFSLLGYYVSLSFPHLKLPFGLETALTGIVFFGAGSLVHEHTKQLTTLLRHHLLLLFTFSSIICIIAATINYNLSGHQIDMRLNRLDNYILFYLGAISGIVSVISLSMVIRANKVLELLGKHSLLLLVWHIPLYGYLSKLLLLFISTQTIQSYRNLFIAPLYTLAASGIIVWVNQLLLRRVALKKE